MYIGPTDLFTYAINRKSSDRRQFYTFMMKLYMDQYRPSACLLVLVLVMVIAYYIL